MKTLFYSMLLGLLMIVLGCTKDDDIDPNPNQDLEVGITGDDLLLPNTQNIIDDHNIPALAAMTMKDGVLLEKVELGKRNYNQSSEILENSKWHIGSITKSMTATLTGILVENGYLNWDTTIGDLTTVGYLPEYQNITILQLLSQTAGITTQDYPVDPGDARPVSEIRQEWAIAVLNIPQGAVGEFTYSNNNYVIAGVMLELIMESSWENLITEYLFEPLEMYHSGFGVPGNDGSEIHPWGHRRNGNTWTPKDPMDVYSDNAIALGPGGTVHTTLSDMSKYVNLHLGKTTLVQRSILDVLHSEVNDSGYALGWNVTENGIFHSGSNTNWFAQLYINLDENFVNYAVTNSYDIEGEVSIPSVVEMMTVLGQRYQNSL